MNSVYLYCGASLSAVTFFFFDQNGELAASSVGSLNADSVWEANVPPGLASGSYTVVGQSGTKAFGKEVINWDGTQIVNEVDMISKGVRDELNLELAHLVSLQNGLTSNQATMLLEIYRLMGLDPSRPLYVSKTARTALPEIDQTIDDNGVRTIVTRN